MDKDAAPPSWLTWAILTGLSIAIGIAYLLLLILAPEYTLDVPGRERPIRTILTIYGVAFVPYWLAWWVAVRARADRWLLWWVIGTSLLWRAILLPTQPFQEIDIYRYLLDGAVASRGHDPYRYSPREVADAVWRLKQGEEVQDPGPLADIAQALLDEAPEYQEVLRVMYEHYGQLPSPYPPVSQAVFAAADATSPVNSAGDHPDDYKVAARRHLIWLKCWLTAFDFATLLVLIWLLRMAAMPVGHAVAYGWCPLVMKEIAGSGHLDSIATFFAVLGLALAIRSLRAATPRGVWPCVLGASLAVALGVGAKLFPVFLAPLLAIVWLRKLGWAAALIGALLIAGGSYACLLPMLGDHEAPEPPVAAGDDGVLPPPPADADTPPKKVAGLSAFLKRWEINDLIFLILVENLRPQQQTVPEKRPWFVVVPDEASKAIVDRWTAMVEKSPIRSTSLGIGVEGLRDDRASFMLARFLTLAAVGIIALVCAWRAARPEADAVDLLRAAFLTLAWFWLLAPTQNPWYWCWVIPLLPFARCHAWSAIAALSLLSYLRFWLSYHFKEPGVAGTPYNGEYYFYFVVPWIEFGPWFIALAVESVVRWLWRDAGDSVG